MKEIATRVLNEWDTDGDKARDGMFMSLSVPGSLLYHSLSHHFHSFPHICTRIYIYRAG